MEISLLKSLLNSITSFLQLSSFEGIKSEPLQKYYQKIEQILKLLKQILDAIVGSEIASDEMLQRAFAGLLQSVDELREICETWQPLMSKIYLVLQVESLVSKARTHGFEIVESLKSSNHSLPAELSAASLEHCVKKIKHVEYEQASVIVGKAIKDHVEGSGATLDSLSEVADTLALKSNQELLIEAVALDKLKENAEQADKIGEVEYIDQMIALVTHMHDLLVMVKQSDTCNPVPIPADFCALFHLSSWLILRVNTSGAPDRPLASQVNSSIPPIATQRDRTSSHPRSLSEDSLNEAAVTGTGLDAERVSPGSSGDMSDHSGERSLNSVGLFLMSPSRNGGAGADERSSQVHNRTNSASSTLSNSNMSQGTAADGSEVASHASAYVSDASGELAAESQPAANLSAPQREPDFLSRLETRSRGQAIWRRPSERLIPRIVSSPTVEMRADLLEVETQVKRLVEDLKSGSLDAQNLAIQENAVTALLNLSINDNNKSAIANANAIEPLIHVLETGSPEAKENSAATLFSLSVIEEHKIKIGRSGAIKPLVDLLGNGTPRGKRDAATALFNLSMHHEHKPRIVQAGAVKYLVELMDPAFGMVDKAVAVLSNLATIHEGRAAIGQEGGIPFLVEVVELGSARGKENAAAALLHLCINSNRFCHMVLQEGAVPPLAALSQTGTPRAREKAQQLLSFFRNQRHGNAARG
ncbi:UNVERIFIED_CONTAM: U-box domain-containing protein 4 [Sesamum radiatum]|uniref:RING-type E3 ubiquitin transferase n=1 Tax=Sesamum radiatum TaxID=300843 RepID=A0AAW2MFP3_SESRA